MMKRQLFQRGLTFAIFMALISGCAGSSPTLSVTELPPPPTQLPTLRPVQQQPVINLPTATRRPPTSTPDATTTFLPSPTLPPPIDRPFLMKIDRISVIAGRGTLLQGRVQNGTMVAGGSIEILGLRGDVFRPSLLALFISSSVRSQVAVGEYAGILVGGIDAARLSPGMLAAQAGEFKSYEEAALQLK